MISPFTLKMPPLVEFGPGKFNLLEDILSPPIKRPLFVLGGQSLSKSPHFNKLGTIIESKALELRTVYVDQEPTPQLVDSAVSKFANERIDIVIGIGGGSVLDAAKAISAMLAEQAPVFNFLEGVGSKRPSGQKIFFVAIPTTSGTGSEATSNAVISQIGEHGFKKSLRHNNYIPDIAIVDPELTLSCPRSLTITCAMDCFSQLVEGYLSTNSSQLTDLLALDGLRAISRSLRLVCKEDGNINAHADLSYATLLSGIVLANAGLGSVHGFASVIGGQFTIPHGVVCATLMAPANEHTLNELRKDQVRNQSSLRKYTSLGYLFSKEEHKSDSWYQDYFIDELYNLNATFDIPTLSKYGFTGQHIKSVAAKTGNKYNPIELSDNILAKILLKRLGEE